MPTPRVQACQDYARLGSVVISPHAPAEWREQRDRSAVEDDAARAERRELWKTWAAQVNNQ